MKIKLTPELSYIIGLWRKSRCPDGLGVEGDKPVLEVFSKVVIDNKLTTPDKFLSQESKVYFYHTAYRKFFQEVEEDQLERFKYLNEYAANYLAGIFDSCGSIDARGVVGLYKMNKQDEILLLRLGFVVRRKDKLTIIERPIVFLTFIKNYVKVLKDHKVFQFIGSHDHKKKSVEKKNAGVDFI